MTGAGKGPGAGTSSGHSPSEPFDPAWAEELAGPLAKRQISEPHWEKKQGAAVAFVDIQELKVRADVANLPERIVVNVDGMTDGTKVFAKDVVLPEGVELDVEDPEESVVTVEVPEDASTEEAPAEAPAAE